MTIRSKLLNASLAATVAAGALVPLASAATAGPRKHDGGYNRDSGRHRDSFDNRRYGGPQHERYVYRKKHRNNAGPAIALGLGALVLGIIASEAGRNHRYSDED